VAAWATSMSTEPGTLAARLAGAGFVAVDEEAAELVAASGGRRHVLDEMVERRLAGEPLAWITGRTRFCGHEVAVHPGVYVPRWHSEPLAGRAAARLPANGVAVDLCTGAGAVALTMARGRPSARVLGTDIDPRAVACARANGVDAFPGDLFDPLPVDLRGRVDVVVAVVPYVPTPALAVLPRDTLAFESPLAYDGGRDGTDVLRRVVAESPRFLRPGGALLLELGGDQPDLLRDDLDRLGYVDLTVLADEEGDLRGIEATRRPISLR